MMTRPELSENARRIARAYDAITINYGLAPTHDGDYEAAVTDTLANLMHLCDLNGIPFGECIERAGRHFEVETAEEGA